MKIIDGFIFYNELDLIKYRLNLLNDVVDYFIIVEATHTFVGKEKILYSAEIPHIFELYKDKIIHIIVDDFPHKYPNINFSKNEQWTNENFQRNSIKRGIDKLKLNNEDLIIISDLDEIPDPNTIREIKMNDLKIQVSNLEMDFYYYNLNCKLLEKWYLAKIISYKTFQDKSISCNDIRCIGCPTIKNGGWHLSYFGNAQFIKNKIENFAHQELNNENFTNIEKIEKRINNSTDLYDRNNNKIIHTSIKTNTYLPPKYDQFLTKYFSY